MMDIITQNKEIMDLLVLQNKEQAAIIKEQYDIIQRQRNLIPTAPRETSFGKIASKIADNAIVTDNLNTLTLYQ